MALGEGTKTNFTGNSARPFCPLSANSHNEYAGINPGMENVVGEIDKGLRVCCRGNETSERTEFRTTVPPCGHNHRNMP